MEICEVYTFEDLPALCALDGLQNEVGAIFTCEYEEDGCDTLASPSPSAANPEPDAGATLALALPSAARMAAASSSSSSSSAMADVALVPDSVDACDVESGTGLSLFSRIWSIA
jgi:hypothetical protein